MKFLLELIEIFGPVFFVVAGGGFLAGTVFVTLLWAVFG